MIFLPDAVNRTVISSLVWTKHRNVTDGRTDGQNRCGYYSGLHFDQCRRAVKIAAMCRAIYLKPLRQLIMCRTRVYEYTNRQRDCDRRHCDDPSNLYTASRHTLGIFEVHICCILQKIQLKKRIFDEKNETFLVRVQNH